MGSGSLSVPGVSFLHGRAPGAVEQCSAVGSLLSWRFAHQGRGSSLRLLLGQRAGFWKTHRGGSLSKPHLGSSRHPGAKHKSHGPSREGDREGWLLPAAHPPQPSDSTRSKGCLGGRWEQGCPLWLPGKMPWCVRGCPPFTAGRAPRLAWGLLSLLPA